jgi:hypothetical protein
MACRSSGESCRGLASQGVPNCTQERAQRVAERAREEVRGVERCCMLMGVGWTAQEEPGSLSGCPGLP